MPTTIWSARPSTAAAAKSAPSASAAATRRRHADGAASRVADGRREARRTRRPASCPRCPMLTTPARSTIELAEGRQQERRREPQRGLEQRVHQPRLRGSAKPTEKRITTPCTISVTTAGIPASRCIAPAPASSAPKKSADGTTASGMQAREERDGDRGVAVPRREPLVEPPGDAGHLEGARRAGQRARDRERGDAVALGRDAGEARRARASGRPRAGGSRAACETAARRPPAPRRRRARRPRGRGRAPGDAPAAGSASLCG